METSTLADRLKYVRDRKLNVSQADLAARLAEAGVGTTSPSVMRYEKGERMPGADYIAALAKIAGVSAGWLLTGDGGMEAAPTSEEAGRVSTEPIGDGERLVLLRLVSQLERSLRGQVPTPAISPETIASDLALLQQQDDEDSASPPAEPDQRRAAP